MQTIRRILLIIPSSVFFFILVPFLSILFGRHLDLLLGLETFEIGLLSLVLSFISLIVGSYYVIESIRILLVRGKGIPLGDLLPNDQSSRLITTGIYGQTRNPMLFGYLLCLISLGLLKKSLSITVIIPVIFILIWTIWLKTREEPALEARFGNEYRRYKVNTPFLIPRPWKKVKNE